MTPFITTFTGKKVNPLDLRPEDVCIEDIAHHLSCLNRFVGALRRPVSIAQHSVFVSRLLDGTEWEREGLFHDASETYLGDLTKWVKRDPRMAAYREAEQQASYTICEALHLRVGGDPDVNRVVRRADDLMVRYENLMEGSNPDHMFDLPSHPRPIEEEIKEVERLGKWDSWSWIHAEAEFLDRAKELGFTI